VTRKVDFYNLPRPVQERFAAATRGAATPRPLLFERAPRTQAWIYLGASVVLLIVFVAVLRAGSGDVHGALALHGVQMIAVDALLAFAVSYCVLHGAGILMRLDAMPFRPGFYLFPGCAVDARTANLTIWPMDAVESIERASGPVTGLALRLRDGSRIVVPAPSAAAAERAEASLEPLRQALARAEAEGDPRALLEFDPLHDRALSSPIGPVEAMRHKVAPWSRFDWALAAALGVVIGFALGSSRNTMSDAAMFREVTAANTVAGYEAYLAQGGSQSDQVRSTLLPLAALRDAEQKGTVEAVQAFVAVNTSSAIGPQIEAAMRRQMLAELTRAKAAGTLAAIDAFARQYPSYTAYVDAEWHAARHAFYARALAAWRQKAQPDAATDAFFVRLLGDVEKAGPAVEMRFRRDPSSSMADADRSVQKSGRYPGVDALPSNYLGPDALATREQSVVDAVVAAFGGVFSPDVLTLHGGDTLAPDTPAPAAVPALVVEYSPEWSRGNTACEKPSTVFAGLMFTFASSFGLPEGPPPLKIVVRAIKTAAVWRARTNGLSREDFEQKVYGAMIDGAFDQLKAKLLDVLL
jgi:hypothetical protein